MMDENIARCAAQMIQNDEAVFLGADSITYRMIPFLKEKRLTIVTNSLQVLRNIQEAGMNPDRLQCFLLGGEFRCESNSICGPAAVEMLKGFSLDKAFFGADGISEQMGICAKEMENAEIKVTAFRHSANTYVLADQNQFYKNQFYRMVGLKDVMLITDVPAEKRLLEQMKGYILV